MHLSDGAWSLSSQHPLLHPCGIVFWALLYCKGCDMTYDMTFDMTYDMTYDMNATCVIVSLLKKKIIYHADAIWSPQAATHVIVSSMWYSVFH